MAREEMPAYKVANAGIGSVTNAELLSLVIGGVPDNALNIARNILAECDGSLNKLATMRRELLSEAEGLGNARINAIMAAMELGRRRQAEQCEKVDTVGTADDIYKLIRPRMQDLEHEVADVILLNQKLSVIKIVRLSSGGLTETAVDVRIMMKEAVLNNATALALTHNHPSGNNHPSSQDVQLTKRVKSACECMRIHFVDHVIYAGSRYYSYMEEGRM